MLVPALLKAAVDEYLFSVDLQTVAAAGDRVGCAKKCQFHGSASFVDGMVVSIVHDFPGKCHTNL